MIYIVVFPGFRHLTVNHQINFVDPDTGAYTQNIERTWRDARSIIPKYGRRKYLMSGYIAEFLYRRKFPDHTERLHSLCTAIADFFNHTQNAENIQNK